MQERNNAYTKYTYSHIEYNCLILFNEKKRDLAHETCSCSESPVPHDHAKLITHLKLTWKDLPVTLTRSLGHQRSQAKEIIYKYQSIFYRRKFKNKGTLYRKLYIMSNRYIIFISS